MKKKGKQFETAVYEFVKKLAPDSKVLFDHKVPDRDTGSLRQVDAWVETNIANHYALSILISCKDYARKVNITHIDAFLGEVRSTGASTGIIYSRNGFTKTAIKKAKVNGMNCCRLYENRLADIPEILTFSTFYSTPKFCLRCESPPSGTHVWGDLLDLEIGENRQQLQDVLIQKLQQTQNEISLSDQNNRDKLPDIKSGIISLKAEDGAILTVAGDISFRHFEARLHAHLVDGSYCINNNSFVGSISTPFIDLREDEPGPGWTEISADSTALPDKAIWIRARIEFSDDIFHQIRSRPIRKKFIT